MLTMKIGKDIFDYINNIRNSKAKQTMKKRVQEYLPKEEYVEKLERIDGKLYFAVFSAEWSPECQAHIPSLAKLLLAARNSNLVVKIVDYDENRDIAGELGALRIPTIIVYDKSWHELGRFVEKPQRYGTIEEELCAIIGKPSK
jgi:thiol-disulfide isomerase/thioredoxin